MGLFGKTKHSEMPPAAQATSGAAAPSVSPEAEALLKNVYNAYFTGLPFTASGTPAGDAYVSLLQLAEAEFCTNRAIAAAALQCGDVLLDRLQAKSTAQDAALLRACLFKTGEFGLIIEDNVYSVDFIDAVPYCVALAVLLTAQKLPAGSRQLVIELEQGTPLGRFGEALRLVGVCDGSLHFSITEAAE